MIKKVIMFCLMILITYMGIKISHILMKKYKINRWIYAIAAVLVIFIPSMLFTNINKLVMNILIVLFSILSITFFEITRNEYARLENRYNKK